MFGGQHKVFIVSLYEGGFGSFVGFCFLYCCEDKEDGLEAGSKCVV